MEVNDTLIEKLADLARLKFDGEQNEEIKGDLNRMLDFVNKLNELETGGVEPLVYMTNQSLQTRVDSVGKQLSQEDALKNGPSHDSDYFKVPKVLDK